jgi:uncharacterized protein YndB with AHSA1/START domain
MSKELIASASIQINAPVEIVWDALTNPNLIKKYMFETEVNTDWKEGSPILWKGKWEGKTYVDKGMIIKNIPLKTIELTHFSPLSGLPDKEENYHTLIYDLSSSGNRTILHLTQDNNPDEMSRNHSEKNWMMMIQNLKNTIEKNKHSAKT